MCSREQEVNCGVDGIPGKVESGGQELVANRTRVEETNANVLGSHEVEDRIGIKAYQLPRAE
jgi:hypothetical protein